MDSSRTRRLTAGAVVVTFVAGLLSLVVLQSASAAHVGTLQVTNEITTKPINDSVVLTARLSKPAPSDGVMIAYELEGTPGDVDGANANIRDGFCTVANDATTCEVTLNSSVSGTGLVRFWIDHDGLNHLENGVGVREADVAEGRLSDSTMFVDERVTPQSDCRDNPTTTAAEDTPNSACNAGTVTPGDKKPEPDDTDVVQVAWSDAPSSIDCVDSNPLNGDEAEKNFRGQNESYTCTVRDSTGNLVSGAAVDSENLAGANDPDDSGPPSTGGNSTPDYDTTDFPAPATDTTFCRTDSSGSCPGVVSGAQGEVGPATLCFWIDTDNDAEYKAASDPDGGGCADETVASNDADFTDTLSITWDDASRSVSSVDVTPEESVGTVGRALGVTATLYDQYGDRFNAATVVRAELFEGSAGDAGTAGGDGNTPGAPDVTCSTNSETDSCTLSFSSPRSGPARFCAWVGATPSLVGTASTGTCNSENLSDPPGGLNSIDVATITWAAGSPPGSTTTTTPPGGGGGAAADQGYTLVGGDGGIFTYGTSKFHGSTGDLKLNEPVIGMANKKGGTGYWLVARDGGIFSFGDAEFFGSTGDRKLNAPVLGMEATPSGRGYYLFAADGGIFTFGDAVFHGSTGDRKLNAPAVGLAVNERGDGYWLVAQDGGIFSFGRVPFHGSTGDRKLNEPVFDMTPTAGDNGYWLVAKDGGIFSFGDAEGKFYGSAVGKATAPVIGIGATPSFNGYWIADAKGAVFHFGDATFLGDRRSATNNAPIVGFATVPK